MQFGLGNLPLGKVKYGERLGNAGGHTPALLILSTAADEAPVNYHKTQGEIR